MIFAYALVESAYGLPIRELGRMPLQALTPAKASKKDWIVWLQFIGHCKLNLQIFACVAQGFRISVFPQPVMPPCADSKIFKHFPQCFYNKRFLRRYYQRMECRTRLTFFSLHSPPYSDYETLVKPRLPGLFAELFADFLKQDKNNLESLSYNTVKSLSRISPLLRLMSEVNKI